MLLNPDSETARQTLRRDHRVRLVECDQEGAAADTLPPGVFGFTGSPALASPLFAVQRYRNFEVHRTAADETLLVAFVTPSDRDKLKTSAATVDITAFPDLSAEASAIVAIPYSRIVHHRQYAVRNAPGIDLRIKPVAQAVTV